MRKIAVLALAVMTLASCKTKQSVVAEQYAEATVGVSSVATGHYANKKDFRTAYIRAGAKYKDSKQSRSMSAEIKILKDEKILISVRFLGITMAKALITPDRVSYYEKIGNKYFEGNYALLSQWLGTELDYAKVQNILLGVAMDDLTKNKYRESLENGLHKLVSSKGNVSKQFLFESANYLLKQQSVSQGGQDARSLVINYPAHKDWVKARLPVEIKIEAEQKDKVNIDIDYDNITFDENLSFPYSVPEGFEQIFLD